MTWFAPIKELSIQDFEALLPGNPNLHANGKRSDELWDTARGHLIMLGEVTRNNIPIKLTRGCVSLCRYFAQTTYVPRLLTDPGELDFAYSNPLCSCMVIKNPDTLRSGSHALEAVKRTDMNKLLGECARCVSLRQLSVPIPLLLRVGPTQLGEELQR